MSNSSKKRDRTARLLRLQVLLCQYPAGLEIDDIARRCAVSRRTVYRDLEALESELNVPIWEEAGKRGIAEGHFLPPITFTQSEAVSLFLAARMMQYFSPQYNTSIASTFLKLNTIVPSFLKDHIQDTIEHLESVPKDDRKISNFDKLIHAWMSGHPVTIKYQDLYGKEPVEHTIEPYFIEPAARNRANYVIGYSRLRKRISTFKIDRIMGEVKIEPDTFKIPNDFNIDIYLSSAWGTYAEQKTETIKLRFSKRIRLAVSQSVFHVSQKNETQPDGTLLMTLKIHNTGDFRAWLLGWGKDVEVIEPKTLRNQISNDIRNLNDIYQAENEQEQIIDKRGRKTKKDYHITDKQWEAICQLLPPQPRTGRPRADDRRTIEAIMFVLNNGIKWNDIPRNYGAASTCFTRLKIWQKQGVWNEISKILNTMVLK